MCVMLMSSHPPHALLSLSPLCPPLLALISPLSPLPTLPSHLSPLSPISTLGILSAAGCCLAPVPTAKPSRRGGAQPLSSPSRLMI